MPQPPEDFFGYILKCIPSGTDFEVHSPLIFSWLAQGSKSFADQFLKNILLILDDPQHPPPSRFYCVLLLLKATEACKDLMSARLAKQRHLLDKMFKDAQFDKQREFEQRGRKFFSRNPTEEQVVLGVNYVRLVLEAIVYWYKTFGTGNTRDPLYIFTLIYNNLSTLLTLPQVFYYAGRELEMNSRLHLQHFLTLTDDPISLETTSKTNVEEAEEEVDKEQTFNDVIACLSSIEDFKANSPLVFNSVAKNSWPYNKVLLRTLNSILTGSGYPPEFKFYALLLAVRLSETQNEIFIQHLGEEKTLLENVLKYAQFEKDKNRNERGKTFFKANPSPREAITGKNFITLSREVVHFWATIAEKLSHRGSKEGFVRLGSACIALASKLELTGDYTFIGASLEDSMNSSLRKFSEDAVKPLKEQPDKNVTKDTNTGMISKRDDVQKYARRAEEHLKVCIASEEGYKETFLVINNSLQQNLGGYVKAFLQKIEQVITSTEKSPREKYYALYLLVKMTKSENKALLTQLEESQSLLEVLFVHAEEGLEQTQNQEKRNNSSQAPQETKDSLFEDAYGRLVCETIIWWDSAYGKDSKSKFHMMYEALSQNNKGLPQDLVFIEDSMDTTPSEAMKNFSEFRAQKQKEDQKLLIEELRVKLDRLAEVKERFRKVLEENEEAIFRNMRIVDSMMKEFTQVYHKEVLLNANLLIDNNVRGSEKFVQRAVLEGDIFEKVSRAYLEYKQQILKYPWFRTEVIKILSDLEGDVSGEMSQEVEMSRVEAQEALDRIMVGKDVVEEAILANEIEDKTSLAEQERQKLDQSNNETQSCLGQRTPGHMLISREKDDMQSAWVYMSGEGSLSSKREISSILNADEDKGTATPSTPKRRPPVDSPASESSKENPTNIENSGYMTNGSLKREVSNWASKVNNTEASSQKGERTSSEDERTNTEEHEEEEEEESNIVSYSAYEAIVNENKKLRKEKQKLYEEKQKLYEENCLMRKHIAENKEQVKLEEASQALEGMRGILLEAQAEMENLYKELHDKNEENKHLKKRCEKMEQEVRFYRENHELRGKLDGLSSEMFELRKYMIEKNSGTVTKNENEELLKRLKDLEEKNSTLAKILEDVQEKNSLMCSKMQELEELQTIATTYRQNTSRLVGHEIMFESKTTQSKENLLEGEEVENQRGLKPAEKGSPKRINGFGATRNQNQENQNENYSEQRGTSPENKRGSNQSPLRILSVNMVQNQNQDFKKEQLSLQHSPRDNEFPAKEGNQSSFSFPKRYFSLQISKCFLPENTEEQDLSSLSVDIKDCLPQNTNTINIEGLGLNIHNKKS